ncbi:hypothetical protein [Spiroplasma endosymbiont of Polydrusus pterygomalis]|uniref:hypothetical protein n=1 Tax=Spiroplasma endosymbiont of Polydrusus pterygomalis TaxID=3139327 RepID=UPI003CCAB17A
MRFFAILFTCTYKYNSAIKNKKYKLGGYKTMKNDNFKFLNDKELLRLTGIKQNTFNKMF